MSLQKNLLLWFSKYQRPLPWRKKYLPYEVWISEVMLQQTQVETVLPYFDRWLKTFPTIQSLAFSSQEKVLKMWEGLGYYSRARSLHHAAQEIVQKYGGQFPQDYETILSLKGIGRYSAGAIASIAFNQEKPIVDGNILRVLSRVYAIKKPIDIEKNKALFWTLQEKLIPKGQARYFNQALMELGALVCSSQNPKCALCPIQKFCKAYQEDEVWLYPVRSKKKKLVKVIAAAVVIGQKDKFFIHKRPLGELMGGLWEFPEWKLAKNQELSNQEIEKKIKINLAKNFGIQSTSLKNLGFIKRNYTHYLETMHIFRAQLSKDENFHPTLNWLNRWALKKEFTHHPFSSAHAKVIQKLTKDL